MSNRDLTQILAASERAIREAYELGFKAGAQAQREKILRAASLDDEAGEGRGTKDIPAPQPLPYDVPDTQGERSPSGRVERGTVRRILKEVMSVSKGMVISEINSAVQALNPRVAQTSVTNELRRNENLYRKDGQQWFLISGNAETETAGTATNDHPAATFQNHGGPQ